MVPASKLTKHSKTICRIQGRINFSLFRSIAHDHILVCLIQIDLKCPQLVPDTANLIICESLK